MTARALSLALGDDALILGQRLGEWCGHAPSVEVDLSLSNLALDLIGQATLLLGAIGDADQLAFKRDVLDFRNCWLVEQPSLPKGNYTVSAVAYWAVTWTINGTSGVITVPRQASTPLPVGEIQVLTR